MKKKKKESKCNFGENPEQIFSINKESEEIY